MNGLAVGRPWCPPRITIDQFCTSPPLIYNNRYSLIIHIEHSGHSWAPKKSPKVGSIFLASFHVLSLFYSPNYGINMRIVINNQHQYQYWFNPRDTHSCSGGSYLNFCPFSSKTEDSTERVRSHIMPFWPLQWLSCSLWDIVGDWLFKVNLTPQGVSFSNQKYILTQGVA